MKKPKRLAIGDKVAIVSLSHGSIGEAKYKHMLDLGIKRLKEFGLIPVFMENALKGTEFLSTHPEAKAADLKQAFANDEYQAVFTSIGGRFTYPTIPYLLEDSEFIEIVRTHPKIFLGFSDTTNNHLMFHKIGLNTFYGPTFWSDFGDLSPTMTPYSVAEFKKMFENPEIREIKSSDTWYEGRVEYTSDQVGIPLKAHQETHGYEVLRGSGIVSGKLLGGCVESLWFGLTGFREPEQKEVWQKYDIFPSLEDWTDKILFLEPSDIIPTITPDQFKVMLEELESKGIFDVGKAIIFGKPFNENYYEELKEVLLEVTKKSQIPILYNINFGHSHPFTTIPYGLEAKIDFDQKRLFIIEPFFRD